MQTDHRGLLVSLFAMAVMPANTVSAQARESAANTMKVTIASGPDRGTHTIALGPKDINGQNTCTVLPRADREPGHYFNAHFYPDMGNKPGLMEAVTAFDVAPGGTTSEASFVVSFVVGTGPDMSIRAYEAETRTTRPRKGRVSATSSRTASGATARVDGETVEGVKVTMEVTCNAVATR